MVFFVFFKQKTAYEMRISDWSSDVCSSDLKAGELAETAEFFSFGTNDLTQTAFGISRDDAASFLPAYQAQGILEHDPFVTLDQDGVGELVRIGVERGKAARPDLKVGIRSEEHTSELQSLMRISYAVVWLKNKKIYRI